MAQLAIQNVHKSFQSKVVLNDVSLELDRGEIVCVFGPSGSGKTLLLRLGSIPRYIPDSRGGGDAAQRKDAAPTAHA